MTRKIKSEEILADLHVHTVFSLHAHSTVKENIDAAQTKCLKYIAITDHYFNDGTILNKKNETARIRYLEDRVGGWNNNVEVIGGAEFNVLHPIDAWEDLKDLKWKILGLHTWFFDASCTTLDDLYTFYEQNFTCYNGFAHIERALQSVDNKKYGHDLTPEIKDYLKRLVTLAKENDKFLELNEGSFVASTKPGMRDKIMYWLTLAKHNGNAIYLGSDAHYCAEVGEFSESVQLLNDISFPKDKILNLDKDWLDEVIAH